ncbi:MAG: DUF2269 family protein [Acidimicrobiia bacterium]|nr:DUF2269 family protein [Acidimicrobiia bacterium]
MLFAAVDSAGFKIVLSLHLVSAIIGFGGIFILGFVGAASQRHQGREGQAVFDTAQQFGTIAEYFIYAVPIFGIALLFMSTTNGTHVYWWDQTWVSLSLLIYIATLGFVHAVLRPNLKRMGALMAELNAGGPPPGGGSGPPPQVAELEARGKRAGVNGAIANLAWVAIVILMVWKPGL